MPVTDDMVATVRAYLVVDKDEFRRLNASLDRSKEATLAYRAMILGTFISAVKRKFAEDSPREDIIEYVTDLRTRGDDIPDILDPSATERMIASVFHDEQISDIDPRDKLTIQLYVSTAIAADQGIRDEELDEFLNEARKRADRLLG